MIDIIIYTNNMESSPNTTDIREIFEKAGHLVGLVSLRHDLNAGNPKGYAQSGKAYRS